MDKEIRNRIQRATQEARRLLETEYSEQLAGIFDILQDGRILQEPGGHLDAHGRLVREKLVVVVEHKRAGGMKPAEAVADYLREAAFTTLNRFVALKMLEARGLVLESISRGEQSSGFKEFIGLAPALAMLEDHGYQLYIESLFDEIGREVGVLFDRRDPASLLWPRRQALLDLLTLLNSDGLAEVWGEDETIGWVYQYFNSDDERKKMRDESAAPRNSRELAVRNQFFTPRYVVQFLTDNTLGRTWYEMRRGQTKLAEECEYLVRRPFEVFLGDPVLASERIFVKSDDGVMVFPEIQAAYNGDLSHLNKDDGPDSRWISVAIPPDQFEKITGSPYRGIHEGGALSDLLSVIDETGCVPEGTNLASFWAALSNFTLGDFSRGYSAPYWKKLWGIFVDYAREDASREYSKEEILQRPSFIPYRSPKDPRDIKILDPACGSGHFLLYAFDLLHIIYEEAWADDNNAPIFEATGKTLREDYADLPSLRAAIPGLILRHNLHGIDIDSRCAQIAALALWMRAQRAYNDAGLSRADRRPITRTNIVIAEPMPGEREMLQEFAATLQPRVLGQMVERIFLKMRCAGEAGSLLKIEEDIKDVIDAARADLLQQRNTPGLLPGMEGYFKPVQRQFDFTDLPGDEFWSDAERCIVEQLHTYANRNGDGGKFRRSLFADDAARGFAFIDLCRRAYDVVLMNPPFGSPVEAFDKAKDLYPHSGRDIYGMFIERMHSLRTPTGLIGAILPRTGLFIGTMSDLRREYYLKHTPLNLLVDLGKDVLDGATVRTACYTFSTTFDQPAIFFRIGNIQGREDKLHTLLQAVHHSSENEDVFIRDRSYFESLPATAIAYWIPKSLAAKLATMGKLEVLVDIRQGIATGDNFRFLRLLTEIPVGHAGFSYYSKGGEPVPFVSDESLYVRSALACAEMKANAAQQYGSASRTIKNEETFGLAGITYSQVNDACLRFRIHPPDALYDMKGPVLFGRLGTDMKAVLAFLNSSAVEDFMRMMTDGRQWHVSALKTVPIPTFSISTLSTLALLSKKASSISQLESSSDETGHYFTFGNRFQGISCDTRSIAEIEEMIDDLVWESYGASKSEVISIQRQRHLFLERSFVRSAQAESTSNYIPSLVLGTAFGRWNILDAIVEKPPKQVSDPFAALPTCPPVLLQNERGLPISKDEVDQLKIERRWDYPIDIPWDGILMDDQGHPLDLVARVSLVMQCVWGDQRESVEIQACEIMGVNTLRELYRKPYAFFDAHIKCYTKNRRKAPIYWQLATPSSSFAVWLYYHRFTKDTFYRVLEHVTLKLDFEERKLTQLRQQHGLTPTAGQRREVSEQEAFVEELRTFRDEVTRVAPLWNPDLDDGVIINFAPCWRLVPQHRAWQKECKDCWDKLVAGNYDWAHLAMHLWPERVVPKCQTDRSLAIAHGLEKTLWQQDDKGKWQPRDIPRAQVDALITERTSEAVKAALLDLLTAPNGDTRTSRRPRRG